MAVAPWDWNASNGSATAAQTRNAYTALISNGNTSGFSYKVWNDLVNKIYEVNRALSRGWKTDYASLSGTRASRTYDELTDDRFNSARFNVNYPWWSWAFDPNRTGYLGRVEVRGVAKYGDNGADIVFGAYILELVQRLNTVIAVINGTQDVEEIRALLPFLLQPETDLSNPGAARIYRLRHKEILTPSALLQSENLPTLTLHFILTTPAWRAVMETESLSSKLEGYVYASVESGGRLLRIPPVSLSQVVRSKAEFTAVMRQLVPDGMTAASALYSGHEGTLNSFSSEPVQARNRNFLDAAANGVKLHSDSIGWHHVRVMLEPKAGLAQEVKKMLESYFIGRILSDSRIARVPSNGTLKFSASAGSQTADALFGTGDPYPLTLHHEVSTVRPDADVRTIQFLEGMNAETALSGPSSHAKLEYDHVATMLRAYMNAVLTGSGKMDRQITGPMAAPVDVTVTVLADAVSDYAPNVAWAIGIALDIERTAHTAKAGHGVYHEYITVTPSGTANTAFTSLLGGIRQSYAITPEGLLSRDSRSTMLSALGRFGHSVAGSMMFTPPSALESGLLVSLPAASGFLESQIIEAVTASVIHTHGFSAAAGLISDYYALTAGSAFSVTAEGTLGSVVYANLTSAVLAMLSAGADIEIEGAEWEYPVIIGTDAAVFQVWLTEQNRKHLFLDPHNGIHHADIRSEISGTADRQFRAGMASEANHRAAVYGTLNARQRGDWEYPVQTGNVLLITQAIDALPHYQYNLEVR